jgi:putative membrane protein
MFTMGSPLIGHMAVHILAMNVVAPVALLALRSLLPAESGRFGGQRIGTAATLQLVLLWGWHLPPATQFAVTASTGALAMHLSLLFAALWFWHCILFVGREPRWRSLLALLITGKLFCLLGVLLTFAPRPLYPRLADSYLHGGHVLNEATLLSDQQLAGLLMLVACPLTYVLASVVLAARWLLDWKVDRSPLPIWQQ